MTSTVQSAREPIRRASADEPPVFSIVVPVHNRPQTILRAVQSCLRQSFARFEIIVVDDGSDVPLAEVLDTVDDGRLFCHRIDRNRGVSNARNIGIGKARGRYIAFLDSDDEFTDDKLAVCHEALLRAGFPDDICLSSRIDIRRGGSYLAAKPGSLIGPDEGLFEYLFIRGGILSTDTLVISTELARKGSFRTDLTRHEDYDFLWQLERAGGRFRMLSESLAIWYDDDVPGRLTKDTGHAQSAYWIASIADKLEPSVYAAFQLRVLGPLASRERRFAGLQTYFRYRHAAPGMPWRSKAICLLKCAAPRLYTRLTGVYVRVAGLRAST